MASSARGSVSGPSQRASSRGKAAAPKVTTRPEPRKPWPMDQTDARVAPRPRRRRSLRSQAP
eukprot:7172729-Alexandrium_andersonii.AAC.1